MNKMRKLIFFIGLFLGCLSVGIFPQEISDNITARDYWPTTGWKSVKPEKKNLDSAFFASMDRDIKRFLPQIRGVVVIRNGYIVF
jgi:hypothetical protein